MSNVKPNRLRWTGDFPGYRSACGRFYILPQSTFSECRGYRALVDTKTGNEYPCLTAEAAKAKARKILKGKS